MRVAVAVLAVNVTYGPARIFYGASLGFDIHFEKILGPFAVGFG
jgi:hypothetical protein